MCLQGHHGVDVELNDTRRPKRKIQGYPTFADFIARDKDAAIYRKFQRLSSRSLLYQQSELHALEDQLDNLDRGEFEDAENVEARQAAVSWDCFSSDQNDAALERRKLHARIRERLKEYHEALILESKVLSLNAPTARVLNDFRTAFKPRKIAALWYRDEHLFDDESDLAALTPADTDRLNVLLKTYFGCWFKDRDRDVERNIDGLYYYPEQRIQYAGLIITTLLSALLLVGAIVCLLFTTGRSKGIRVGLIVLFTCAFAATVGLLTNARRAEIFMSTAAYAAVLVVFLGNITPN